jgi:2-polyprenyl-3-methyl-5-hydroxy-6-metoxy-1,4-benzoquinol methylase
LSQAELPENAASPYQLKTDVHSSHAVILALLAEGHGRRLLDVGAAQGYLAEALTARGFEVTCLEGDPMLAAVASSRGLNVIVADLDNGLPALSGPFDVIICGDVLEHLKAPLAVLQALAEQLAPSGCIFVSIPNIAHLLIRLQLLLGRFEYTERGILDRTHLRFFTLTSFKRLLQEADLEIARLVTTPVPLPLVVPERYHGPLFRVLHGLNAFLALWWKGMFAYQFVAMAYRREDS